MTKYRFDQIAINSTEKKKPVESDRFTYLGLEHLDSGSLKVTRFGSETAPIGEKLVMHKGDVLFGKRRAYQKKVAIAPFDGIFSAHGMVLRPKEEVVDKAFFPIFISSDYFLDAAIKISVGSLSPTINWRDLKELEFELPDLATQRKLAELLWSINNTLEKYKQLISATDDLVKSQFIEMHSQYPRVKFKELFTTHARIGWQKLTQKEFLDEGEYYLVTGWDIMPDKTVAFSQCKYVTKERYEQDPKLILSKGDVLLTKDGTLGKVAIIGDMDKPATLNGHIFVIRPKDERMLPEFLLGILTSADFVDQMYRNKTGSTIVGITQKAILEFDVPLAPVEAQKEYILFARQSDKSKFELKKALSELTATYKQIIKENIG